MVAPMLALGLENTFVGCIEVTRMWSGAVIKEDFVSWDAQSVVGSPSSEVRKNHREEARALTFWLAPLFERGVEPYDFQISLPKYDYVIFHNSSFCWPCPEAPGFVLDLGFCAHDSVPAGMKVMGAVLLAPSPGRAGDHPSAPCGRAGKSYQSLLHRVKQLMPVLGLIRFRACQLRFRPLPMSLYLIPEVT